MNEEFQAAISPVQSGFHTGILDGGGGGGLCIMGVLV